MKPAPLGYVRDVSFKGGTATFAAILFLLCGVEVAQASGIGDFVDDVPAVADTALPNPEDAGLGDVVEEATQAVDEVTEAVDEAVEPVDTEAVVSDAKGAVDEAVADPKGTVENIVEQLSGTVDGVAGDAGRVVDSSSVGKAASGVTNIANPVASAAQSAEASRSEAAEPAPLRPQSESAQALVSRAPKGSQTQFAAPARLKARANASESVVGSKVTVPEAAVQRPSLTRNSLPPPAVVWNDAFSAPQPTTSHNASSAAPVAPFAPPPGDQPATAASVAGAAGAALLAALFSAFLFLAPRRGRLIRPGPILVRPDPCLSLSERPG